MQYDFDEVIDRRHSNSLKYNVVDQDVIPMWVADMDFKTLPKVREAIVRRAENGAYGYVDFPDDYYACQVDWWKKRHGVNIEEEWIEFCTGVIPSLSSAVAALVKPGEKVIIQSPVYNYFNTSIVNNKAIIVEDQLVLKGNHYEMDFLSFEQKIIEEDVKMYILCNPHNPVGRAWTKEELLQVGNICKKHGVYVVSDEIHGDLILDGHQFCPFISVDESFKDFSITCTAPSKTFNLAGLKNANMIIPNKEIKKKVNRASNDKEVAESNVFGVEGLIAAYRNGEVWLEELLIYLSLNRGLIKEFIEKQLPKANLIQGEATYLAWIDLRAYGLSSIELMELLNEKGRVRVSSGSQFGDLGDGFIRINFACPRQTLMEGLNRIGSVLCGL